MRLKRKNSHPIQLPCQPKKPATLPQSQKKSFNICHNLANNPKEVFIKREKEEKDDTLKMTSTSEQDTQPFFNENITPLPQNTTIPITSGTCDEPKMQKTTSTTILSTAKECDQLIPVSLTDDNCPDPKSWLHPQDPGKKSDTLKAIAINKETSAEQDTHPFIKENATHSLKSTTISINTGVCDDSMQDTTSTNLSSGITKEYNQQIPVLVIADSSPDPKSWLHLQDPEDPTSTLTLYEDSKDHILNKTTWLCDSEIHAGQILLKQKFPLVDGLRDPVIVGALVTPAISEFVQIINTGSHWVCLSTIATSPGTVKVYDSLYQNVSAVAIDHSCRMLLYTGSTVTFCNERVQKQTNSNDCGLFALAFATDLCHGLDPTVQSYDQDNMCKHHINCLDSHNMVPFPRTSKQVPYHAINKRKAVTIYCVCRMPYDKKSLYVECCQCKHWSQPT